MYSAIMARNLSEITFRFLTFESCFRCHVFFPLSSTGCRGIPTAKSRVLVSSVKRWMNPGAARTMCTTLSRRTKPDGLFLQLWLWSCVILRLYITSWFLSSSISTVARLRISGSYMDCFSVYYPQYLSS